MAMIIDKLTELLGVGEFSEYSNDIAIAVMIQTL